MMHLALDPGSTHLGDKRLAQKLIDVAAHAYHTSGAGDRLRMSVKFQLFKRGPYDPNIELNRDLFMELVQYGKQVGIPVTASAFDKEALDLLVKLEVPYIKFAYSHRKENDWIQGCVRRGMLTVVSSNPLDVYDLPLGAKNLIPMLCEPEYPVLHRTEFQGMFPPFQGYSDHHKVGDERDTPDIRFRSTCDAVRSGATWIERHMTLDESACMAVPDGRFGLRPAQIVDLARKIWTWTPSS